MGLGRHVPHRVDHLWPVQHVEPRRTDEMPNPIENLQTFTELSVVETYSVEGSP